MFKRGLGDERILDPNFFGKMDTENLNKISKIKYSDCWLGDTFISRTELNNKFECELSEITFLRLQSALFYFRAKKGGQVTPESSTSIAEFLNSFKKGSRFCRNILVKRDKKTNLIVNQESVRTFFELISEPVCDCSLIENTLALWSIPALPNSFREFLFKFFNNKLGLNLRTAHFGGDTRFCTFCLIENNHSWAQLT